MRTSCCEVCLFVCAHFAVAVFELLYLALFFFRQVLVAGGRIADSLLALSALCVSCASNSRGRQFDWKIEFQGLGNGDLLRLQTVCWDSRMGRQVDGERRF